ncbi:MAG: Ltp family lipoprotein [Gulosibacter sp.]|uniref:Ltp family lipoprotein n=1 Tax=Gulosibacter sp. TaxID=2817531 RepID=UPI003F93B315
MSNPWANPTTAGWYADPLKRGTERYFDGTAWTNESRPVEGAGSGDVSASDSDRRDEKPREKGRRSESRPAAEAAIETEPVARQDPPSLQRKGDPKSDPRSTPTPTPAPTSDPNRPSGYEGSAAPASANFGAIVVIGLFVVFMIVVAVWGSSAGLSKDENDDSNYGYDYSSVDDAMTVAESYLDSIPMSAEGLVDQLKFEGFDAEVAEDAVNRLEVDWCAQAELEAREALAYQGYSEQGLKERLQYSGFTPAEAAHGVAQAEIDEAEQAIRAVEHFLKYSATSYAGMVDRLMDDGFTRADAIAAVEELEIDWFEQAVLKAESYSETSNLSGEDLHDLLVYEQFTEEQVAYAMSEIGE